MSVGVRLGYMPALDGLRAVAVGLVIADHARVPFLPGGGNVGVTLFFVLSGFLITSLLVAERRREGRVNLLGFYRRRAVRLLPALAFMLAIVVPLAYVLWSPSILTAAAAVGLYVGNWSFAGGFDMGPLVHTWSLAIEEQFYIVWPLILLPLLAWSRRGLIVVTVGLIAAIVAWRVILADDAPWPRLWGGTDVRADALLVGCLLAVVTIRPRPVWWVAVAGGLVLPSLLYHQDARTFTIGLPIAIAASALAVSMASRGARWLEWEPLRNTGRIAYGLYLWNLPAAWIGRAWFGEGFTFAGLALELALTIIPAVVSWHFIEQPAQRWRSSHARNRQPVLLEARRA